MCWASIRNGKLISDGCEYTLSYDECLPLCVCVCVCVPSWVSRSGLDLPATRAAQAAQSSRTSGWQSTSHSLRPSRVESRQSSCHSSLAPPAMPLHLPLPLHDYRASIFAKPELRICSELFGASKMNTFNAQPHAHCCCPHLRLPTPLCLRLCTNRRATARPFSIKATG